VLKIYVATRTRNKLLTWLSLDSSRHLFSQYFTSQREEFEATRESMLVWLTELDLQLTNVEHFSESDVHHKIQQLNVRHTLTSLVLLNNLWCLSRRICQIGPQSLESREMACLDV